MGESTAELVNHCLSTWFWQECTTVCLCGFYRNVPQLMTAVPCLPSTPVPSMRCKGQIPLAINIFKFPDDMHLILLKSCFDVCLECQVTVLSKLNSKKRVFKKYWYSKKSVHQLDSSPQPPECKSVALPNELSVLWFLMECCLSFSLQAAAEPSWSPH